MWKTSSEDQTLFEKCKKRKTLINLYLKNCYLYVCKGNRSNGIVKAYSFAIFLFYSKSENKSFDIDGNKINNKVSNLRWVTSKIN